MRTDALKLGARVVLTSGGLIAGALMLDGLKLDELRCVALNCDVRCHDEPLPHGEWG